jgi:hypothetical protein
VVKLVSITLSVPEDMKTEMDMHQEMNWSAVAREAIKNKLLMLARFKKFTKDSKISERDAITLGRQVTDKAAKRHL